MRRLATLLLAWLLAVAPATAQVTGVDWPAFLARNDMVWPTLPDRWENAAFVGNGALGTIAWQEDGGPIRFEISRSDLYDHRRIDHPNIVLYTQNRLPNGQVRLDFGKGTTGQLRLDLWNAELRGTITANGASWAIRAFAPAGADVIAIELTGPAGAAPPRFDWTPELAMSTRPRLPQPIHAYPPQRRTTIGGIDVSVQEMPEDARYNTAGRGAGQYATAWAELRPAADRIVWLVTTKISYPGRHAAADAAREIAAARRTGLAALERDHRAWWHAYYPKSFVSVPDAAMESFYWIQMYKMGSASRRGGPLVDLMGPWFQRTNWPAAWWNLNIQLTYWPFYMANHLDEAEPLARVVWEGRRALAANAAPYSADSLAIGRATGPSLEQVVGAEIGNLPWVMHDLWLYYRSSMDDRFLRERLFPLMKGSYAYLRHIAVTRPDGTIALPPSASPEYADSVADSSYSTANFRWLATTLIEADARLRTGDPVVADARNVLARLAPYPVDPATGVMVGKDMPLAVSHRHWSHLFMIYPFHEWDWDDPARRPLMEQSLDHWTGMTKGFAGYSWLGAASMHASAGRGDRALGFLTTFIGKSPLPNTLYREGSPVIETPLAFARTLQEMLMTSHGGVVRIFPGIPDAWPDVSFADLRAEGAFLVSASRRGGATQGVSITSLAGEPLRVRPGFAGARASGNRRFAVTDRGDGTIDIDLRRGETVVLSPGGARMVGTAPVTRATGFRPWGAERGANTVGTAR